jgi:segregation and condensation protein A
MAENDELAFDDPSPADDTAEAALIVDVDGFEGPLDLLLALARTQKVDLTRISILALANQYLGFIEKARALRLELAADYLVMAAWLAYLKSRLLLPDTGKGEEPTAEDMAQRLAMRLQRLETLRLAAEQLGNRPRLGRDVFARGEPETVAVLRRSDWSATLYDLLSAYSSQRQKAALSRVQMHRRTVWSMAEARQTLERLIGSDAEWASLQSYLANYNADPQARTTMMASSFSATLELVREGKLELHQSGAFAPLFVRRKPSGLTIVPTGGGA